MNLESLKNNFFLLAMIVIIPAVSWMFLRTGVDYRLESLKDLERKEMFNSTLYIADTITFLDKVTLIAINADDVNVMQLYDQFKDAPVFQFISTKPLLETVKNQGNFIELSVEDSHKLKNNPDFLDGKYALIDGDSNLRKVYTSEDELQMLVRHVATILPYIERKKDKKK